MLDRFSAILAAIAIIIGVAAGWKVRDWQCDAAYAKAFDKAEKQRRELQGKIDDISTVYQIERDKADVVVSRQTQTIREIYKTVPNVPADCAVDVRVFGMLESSVANANANASGKPSN